MLNNQDFAQSKAKSLGQSATGQVLAFPQAKAQTNNEINIYQEAKERLAQTIRKIEGAYAPATIRAYRSNFEFSSNIVKNIILNRCPAPRQPLQAT